MKLCVAGGAYLAGSWVIPTELNQIAFKDALADPRLRQAYIDQLVAKEGSHLAGKIIYDHDSSKSDDAFLEVTERLAEDARFHERIKKLLDTDQEFAEGALKLYSDNSKFKNYEKAKRAAKIKSFLRSSEGVKEFADYIAYLSFVKSRSKSTLAGTINYPYDFDTGKNSDIYILKKAFERSKANIETANIKVSIKIPPSEELLRSILGHEYAHCNHNFYGINLSDELKIKKLNRFEIDPDLLDFIDESLASIWQIEFTRQFNKKAGPSFKSYHPAYLFAVANFDSYWREEIKKIKNKKLIDFDRRLFEHQMLQIKEIDQESLKVFQDIEFYNILRQK